MNLGGSEIYRISPDGSPRTIWSNKEDLVYALAFDAAGRLVSGHGQQGKAVRHSRRRLHRPYQGQCQPSDGLCPRTQGQRSMLPPAISAKYSCSAPTRSPKAPTRAMFLTPRSSPSGDGRKFAGPAISRSSPAAATLIIPTATGVPGRKSIWQKICPSARRLPDLCNGKPCSIPANPRR